jgi:hypothetical protein
LYSQQWQHLNFSHKITTFKLDDLSKLQTKSCSVHDYQNNGTVRTVNFVTLKKLNAPNKNINVTFQEINGTKPKMIVSLCLKTLSF